MSSIIHKEVVEADQESFVSWGSILAGVVIALTVGLVFNLLGTGIGFSVFLPKMEVLKPLGVGTFFWLILTAIVSMYMGGWVASYFSNIYLKATGIVYGLLVSGISAFISLIIMTTAVSFVVSGSLSALGTAISASSSIVAGGGSLLQKGLQGVSAISPNLTNEVKKAMPDLRPMLNKINQKAFDLLPKEQNTASDTAASPEKIKSQLEKLIQDYLEADQAIGDETAKVTLANELGRLTGKSANEIQEKINEWQKMYIQAKEKAYEAAVESAKKIATLISEIALINCIILLTGIIAAISGAINGMRKEI